MDKDVDAFRTISEVADDLGVPQHVLRFWEMRFPQIKPMKRSGGRRYYRPEDVDLLKGVQRLLYGEGYTIKGVQRILQEQGAHAVIAVGRSGMDFSQALPVDVAPTSAAASLDDQEAGGWASGSDIPRDHLQLLEDALLNIQEGVRVLAAAREGAVTES